MNEVIEPGTRVRSTEDQYPELTEGTYVEYREFEPYPHWIMWDQYNAGPGGYPHLRHEFEVIS